MSTWRGVKTESDHKWKRDPDDDYDALKSFMKTEPESENDSRRGHVRSYSERSERNAEPDWKGERSGYNDDYSDMRSYRSGPSASGGRSSDSRSRAFHSGTGQYHCETCDVKVPSHSMYVAHLSGKEHKRKAKPIERFYCDVCLIEVSSAETLENHNMGAQHKKKVAHMQEESRKRKRYAYLEDDGVSNAREENIRLRAEMARMEDDMKNLQEAVRSLSQQLRYCKLNHGD